MDVTPEELDCAALTGQPRVALVHDYLTQRGGAERVVLAMTRAFPGVPVHTSLYYPTGTFPDLAACDVRTSQLNRIALLRRHHRLALPFLAPTFSRLRVDAEVVVCSSSGWAHGIRTSGRKVVYCYAPARWLYQDQRYLGRGRRPLARRGVALLGPHLRAWDQRAAATASRYIATSAHVQAAIRAAYGQEAEILPPPPALYPVGPVDPPEGIDPGFLLCVSRLMAYKNVDAIVAAVATVPDRLLVVVGGGPEEAVLRATAPSNVRFVGQVSDARLRWLYTNCAGVVAASYEDYGLTPLEGAAFGKPAAVLRWGGFVDTVIGGKTGVFFDQPEPVSIAKALEELANSSWSQMVIRAHAARYGEERFIRRLREIVAEEVELS